MKKFWVVELEKNVTINIAIPKEDGITEETAIALAFEDLNHEDKKNYEFKNIWEESHD
jgi:hypothetical protein